VLSTARPALDHARPDRHRLESGAIRLDASRDLQARLWAKHRNYAHDATPGPLESSVDLAPEE
jgi:hypothetical protein